MISHSIFKWTACLALLSFGYAGPVPDDKPTHYPDWWFERDVIPRLPAHATNPNPIWPDHYPPTDDFSAANIGQLKNLAFLAAEDMDIKLPGGSGPVLPTLTAAWLQESEFEVPQNDYTALNQGQLKYIASLFYDRLEDIGYTGHPLTSGTSYPWSGMATDDDSYALVNLGQLKYIFSFSTPEFLSVNVGRSIDQRIINTTPAVGLQIFDIQSHNANPPAYQRNINCWAADLDLTCISPWNSTGANKRAGTLISPRHIIFAAHYQISTGSTIRFVDKDNNLVTRTISATKAHPAYSPYYPDLVIGLLNEEVPPTISYAKVLPDDWSSYLPSETGLPTLCLDQEEKALVTDLRYLNANGRSYFQAPTDSTRLGFHENKISGDSGNPAFLIIDSQLVILTVWTFGGAGSGTSITALKSDINTMMTELGGGYQLTEINLTRFFQPPPSTVMQSALSFSPQYIYSEDYPPLDIK